MVRLPIEPRGSVEFQVHGSAGGPAVEGRALYRLTGTLTGHGLGYIHQGVEISNISVAAYADLSPNNMRLGKLDLSTPNGRFHGTALVAGWERVTPSTSPRISVQGTIDGVSIGEVGRLASRNTGALSATLSGPLKLEGLLTTSGLAGVVTSADLTLKPGDGGLPAQGALALSYDQRTGQFSLGDSRIVVGSSEARLSGTLGGTLALQLVSRNLNDVIPVLRALGATLPPAGRWNCTTAWRTLTRRLRDRLRAPESPEKPILKK